MLLVVLKKTFQFLLIHLYSISNFKYSSKQTIMVATKNDFWRHFNRRSDTKKTLDKTKQVHSYFDGSRGNEIRVKTYKKNPF